MNETLPKRKKLRLEYYDYRQHGAYFVTICTRGKQHLLGEISKQRNPSSAHDCVCLSRIGRVTEFEINKLSSIYDRVKIDKYVIMPNHLHLIIIINNVENGQTVFAPTLSRIIKQFKGSITKQIGYPLWQRSFYDHVIRSEQDYRAKWKYIDENPWHWQEDEYY
ncbi:MAG TPA: hypothetical protein VFC74_02190 [Oscillospiraceae bacterium]|nr:hypothetical protein [Oscillospiraceae bacterium]